MKNFFNFLLLSYKLLINKNDSDELCIILDDSHPSLINTNILRKLCTLGLFFKLELVIYKGKTANSLKNITEVEAFIENFEYSFKPFKLSKILERIPTKSFKIIYSDFRLEPSDNEAIDNGENITLLSNDFNFASVGERNIIKMSA